MKDQLLDSMDLERERGITIKSHPRLDGLACRMEGLCASLILVRATLTFLMKYLWLAACEGAMLLIDAAQGIEAQTVANAHLAIEHEGLEIIPVINKVDLPGADIPAIQQQLEDVLAIPAEEAVLTSGKTGIGVEDLMEAAVARVPKWADVNGLRVLIFDCVYDAFKGVICYVRVFSGSLRTEIASYDMSDRMKAQVKEVGEIFSGNDEAGFA